MTPPPTRGYVEYEAPQSDPRSAKYDPLRPTDDNAYQPKVRIAKFYFTQVLQFII